MRASRRYYLAHFVLVAVVTQLTLMWCVLLLSLVGPWHPHFTGGGIDLGGPRGADALGAALLIGIAMLALGALTAYVVVTSLVALAMRGHWSILVLDVLLACGALALFFMK
jgi:hypothetical protein